LRELNNNIWLTPYLVEKEILNLLTERGFHYYTFYGGLSSDMNEH
jgi:hypothetical protein